MNEVDDIIKKLIKKISFDSPKVIWSETLDKNILEKFMNSISEDTKIFIENKLCKILLPVTGAHGDLKDEHFFIGKDKKYYIIDWEFFRPTGSIITDCLRLYSLRQVRKLRKEGIVISQYDPMSVMNYGINCSIDLSEIGEISEIALLTMLSNCCMPSTGHLNNRLKKFNMYIGSFKKTIEEMNA
ncbi:MAG: hypothetical protein H7A26_06945 [Spirochaetales bacterium]|nr:hypothetical protein [Spirochaetales bacterium]